MNYKAHVIKLIRQQILTENPQTNNFALPSHLAKKVQTYMSMREDLILCIKTITELKKLIEQGPKDKQQHILTALWNSMIIIYAKCFVDASKAKKSKVEINTMLNTDRQDLLDLHKNIMDTRHNFIAHRGDTENEQAIVFFSLPKKPDSSKETTWGIKSLRANNFGLDNLHLCEELFTKILNAVQAKLYSELEKIHNHVKTLDKEELKTWLINPDM